MKKTKITECVELWQSLGVQKGDRLLIFSNVSALGLVENSLDGVLASFQNVVGPEGTLVWPTFSFSFCNNEVFNVQKSKSTCGVLTNHILTFPNATRSIHANHSLVGIGPQTQKALRMTDRSSFGAGSAFTSMLELKFKVLLTGAIHNTYVHYVEQKQKVEYRYNKEFSGTIENNGETFQDSFTFFVRKEGLEGLHTEDRESQRGEFFATNACKEIKFGYGVHRLFHAEDFCDFMIEKLNQDPLYLVDKKKYFESRDRLSK